MGPVGSSKSSACIQDLVGWAAEQQPNAKGERWTRFLVTRSTFPELKSTTIKTFQEWFPFAHFKWDSPITAWLSFSLPDKTKVRSEWIFMPIERPEDVGKLKSFEVTAAWMNEASEMSKAALDMITQRVGRYPRTRRNERDEIIFGPTYSGVLMDTNPPDDDHWYYKLVEETDPEEIKQLEATLKLHGSLKVDQPLLQFFKQPGGLLESNGKYEPNPEAENIKNLPGGYGYYLRMIVGKTKNWIKVFVLGQYGSTQAGKPVYAEYNDETHTRDVGPNPGLTLLLGFDAGLTPGCAFMQINHRGQLIILDELQAEDMGMRQFARDVVQPHLALHYNGYKIIAFGDPAGMQRAQSDEKTAFGELAEEGIVCFPTLTNDIAARTGAVRKFLTKMTDGQPGFLLNPKAKLIRKGFNGAYCYDRIQITGPEPRFKEVPTKNKFSHIMNAVEYGAYGGCNFNLNADYGKPLVYPKKTGII